MGTTFSIQDAEYGLICGNFTAAPTCVSLSTTTATSAALTQGYYRVVSTIDCFLKQGGSTITAATTDNWVPAGVIMNIVSDATKGLYVAGITAAGTGTLYLSKVL